MWFLFLPSYVTATGASSLARSLFFALSGLVATAISAPIFGRMSDAVGRRPVLMGASAVLAVAVVPLYLWMLGGSTAALLAGSVIVGVTMGAFVIPAFFAEQFPIRVRATGLGLAYGLGSAVIGGTAPLLATVLSRQVPGVRGALLPGRVGGRRADRGPPVAGIGEFGPCRRHRVTKSPFDHGASSSVNPRRSRWTLSWMPVSSGITGVCSGRLPIVQDWQGADR